MKVLLTGGGSGGHITPLLAVAQKLKQLDPSVEIVYVGERKSRFAAMTDSPAARQLFDHQYTIFAGKFRRYYGQAWWRRLVDVKTNLANLRDVVYVGFGLIQSWRLLRRLRPDVILMKGGYVGVPIGLAAGRRIPLVTHDSDVLPGLANRLAGRRAVFHATALPAAVYPYPAAQTRQVGVIVSGDYRLVDSTAQKAYKKAIDAPADAPVLMVTGGSLGARSINQAMAAIAPSLLAKVPSLWLVHQVGKGNTDCYKDYQNPRLKVMELADDLASYLGAADLVVTRAGANTLAELGVQGKPAIVVPNPHLTGGHQTKNGQYLADQQAIVVVKDSSLANQEGRRELESQIETLLDDQAARHRLGQKLHQLTILDGAERLAKLLVEAANRAAGEGQS